MFCVRFIIYQNHKLQSLIYKSSAYILNSQAPSIVAFNEKEELVGYTLSFPLTVRKQVLETNEFLLPFFDLLEKLAVSFCGVDKVIMGGQLCVAKSARGKGLAVRLLRQQQDVLKQLGYSVVITEVLHI